MRYCPHYGTRPDRLNLAIANKCFVSCAGCYAFFDRKAADLSLICQTVKRFVALGIDQVTLSGGDPLTIPGLPTFLATLHAVGIRSVKLDTVGSGLAEVSVKLWRSDRAAQCVTLKDLVPLVDFLGIPVDGWSDESVHTFRTGRARLLDETVALIDTLEALDNRPGVIINTVAHRLNIHGLVNILRLLSRYQCICQWNVFQYTPTDQVSNLVNERYAITERAFYRSLEEVCSTAAEISWAGPPPKIEFHTVVSRLGEYLLINSDGEAWFPDEFGNTVHLGRVFGNEECVLRRWCHKVARFRKLKKSCARRVAPQHPITSSGTTMIAKWSS